MAYSHPRDIAPIDPRTKGIPAGTPPFLIEEIASRGWNVLREDMPLPLAILREEGLNHNGLWMKRFLEAGGAHIAPHGKTTMSPQLFDRQLADGAWGLTVATPHQVHVALSFGYRRIFLANQLVGRAAIAGIVGLLRKDPSVEFYCLVDDVGNVEALADAVAAAAPGRPLNVLVEVGYPGGRTGCRTVDEAITVVRAVHRRADVLALAGIEGFEGLMRGRTGAESRAMVQAYLADIVRVARLCEADGAFGTSRPILSAGGSQYYDLVVEAFAQDGLADRFLVLLRSGCYLTHDSHLYRIAFEQLRERNPVLAEQDGGLQSSLEIWAYVQSRPERTKAIVGFGKRDASHDDLPVPETWLRPGTDRAPRPVPDGHRVLRLNDQHCHLEIPPDSPLRVGDMMSFGISHPCLTFDKWRVLYVVDGNYDVVSAVRTYF